jgi:hypothetical protein
VQMRNAELIADVTDQTVENIVQTKQFALQMDESMDSSKKFTWWHLYEFQVKCQFATYCIL